MFISLIQPYTIKYTNNLHLTSKTTNSPLGCKKLYLKQSYMILTWVIYLMGSSTNSKYFVFPKKLTKLTLTKSPMAHKTFSQEQYKFEFFKLIVPLTTKSALIQGECTIKNSLHFALNLRDYYTRGSIVGTNLFFLQKHNLKYSFPNQTFFRLT